MTTTEQLSLSQYTHQNLRDVRAIANRLAERMVGEIAESLVESIRFGYLPSNDLMAHFVAGIREHAAERGVEISAGEPSSNHSPADA